VSGSRHSVPERRMENDVYSSIAAFKYGLTRTINSLHVEPLSKLMSSFKMHGSEANIARSPCSNALKNVTGALDPADVLKSYMKQGLKPVDSQSLLCFVKSLPTFLKLMLLM